MSDPDVSPRPRVMVLDDQVVMLRLLARALSQYEVTQLSDPAEALAKLRSGERFDAIVCDFYMPGMTGANLQEELRRLDAAQAGRMIFLTGALLGDEEGGFVRHNPGRVLRKPVDLAGLRAVVAEVLRGR